MIDSMYMIMIDDLVPPPFEETLYIYIYVYIYIHTHVSRCDTVGLNLLCRGMSQLHEHCIFDFRDELIRFLRCVRHT